MAWHRQIQTDGKESNSGEASIMAIQVEGNRLTLRWHEAGLIVIRTGTMESLELDIEEANEFAQLWAIGEGAIITGQRFMPHFPIPNVVSNEDGDDE
jgi:hypothetical protein